MLGYTFRTTFLFSSKNKILREDILSGTQQGSGMLGTTPTALTMLCMVAWLDGFMACKIKIWQNMLLHPHCNGFMHSTIKLLCEGSCGSPSAGTSVCPPLFPFAIVAAPSQQQGIRIWAGLFGPQMPESIHCIQLPAGDGTSGSLWDLPAQGVPIGQGSLS